MNKVKCETCKGTGNIPHFKHIADGVCFTCEGKGYYTLDSDSYKKHVDHKNRNAGTYILFENGKITNIIESNSIVDPNRKKGDNLVPEQLNVNNNTVYYRSQYNSFTKKSEVYSASFKRISPENTLEIITRLIKCDIKNTIELFKAFGDTEEKLNDLKLQLENAESEARKQLSEYGC